MDWKPPTRTGRGYSVVHKFGDNPSVGTSFAPVTIGGVYQTPQVGSATTLRVKAGGNANDTAAGSGAREITLIGLDETGEEVAETLATAGASASAATSTTFIRLYRAYVSKSGTYATQSAGSHSAAITIENGSGGTDWATISATDFPRGQTEIGAYTVPMGCTAWINKCIVSVQSNKTADVLFFQRQGVLQTAAPYDSMRVVIELGGVEGEEIINPDIPFGPFPPGTDIGFMAKAATAAECDVDFEIILIYDDEHKEELDYPASAADEL